MPTTKTKTPTRNRPITAPHAVPRARLARAVRRAAEARELSQSATASIVDEAPSQMSLLFNGKLAGFSTDQILRTLVRLGHDVEIRITKRPSGRPGRVRVVTE